MAAVDGVAHDNSTTYSTARCFLFVAGISRQPPSSCVIDPFAGYHAR
jgi:hypothetical protein